MYERLRIRTLEVAGLTPSLIAMRLPINQNIEDRTLEKDLNLASKLIRRGDDHAKCIRGCMVWCEMSCQVGWLLEYLTYRIGVECLSSSSAMHNELKGLHAEELAGQKQRDLSEKVYTRIEMISYQTLRRMYLQRRKHRHPDWRIFCGWVETVPYFNELIYPEGATC
jgi:hypothetical protein